MLVKVATDNHQALGGGGGGGGGNFAVTMLHCNSIVSVHFNWAHLKQIHLAYCWRSYNANTIEYIAQDINTVTMGCSFTSFAYCPSASIPQSVHLSIGMFYFNETFGQLFAR